jgi:hypothetical protein
MVLLGSAGAHAASAPTVRVDDDRVQCPHAAFTDIGEVLQAVGHGGTVQVCPGTYVGTHGLVDGRLTGLTGNAADVRLILHLRGCPEDPLFPTAILNMTAGSTLENVTLHARRDDDTCPTPFDVVVTTGSVPFAEAAGIDNVRFHGNGILVGDDDQAFEPGTVIVRHSTYFGGGGDAVRLQMAGSRARVSDSLLDGGGGSGVFADEGTSVEVARNEIRDFGTGVVLGSDAGGIVRENDISRSDVGIATFSDPRTRVNVARNTVHDNRDVGILAASAGAKFVQNVARRNGTVGSGLLGPFDCRDLSSGNGTAGTANTWLDNIGATASPPGICVPPVT